MVYGRITDGFIDMTGGIDETFPIKELTSAENQKDEIKRILIQALERKALLGCSIHVEEDDLDNEYYMGIYGGTAVLFWFLIHSSSMTFSSMHSRHEQDYRCASHKSKIS